MPDLTKWRAVARHHGRLLLAVLIIMWFVRLSLWCFGYKRLRQLLSGLASGGCEAPSALLRRVGATVAIVSRAVPRATCLVQALTAQIVLGIRHHPSEIIIGIDAERVADFASAHAWLMSGDVVVTGGSAASLAGYRPLYRSA